VRSSLSCFNEFKTVRKVIYLFGVLDQLSVSGQGGKIDVSSLILLFEIVRVLTCGTGVTCVTLHLCACAFFCSIFVAGVLRVIGWTFVL